MIPMPRAAHPFTGTRSPLTLFILLVFALPFGLAEAKSGTRQLRIDGMNAYAALPSVPGLQDAPLYSDAMRNLYAYEQRCYRNNDGVGDEQMRALVWLADNLKDFKTGKGDSVNARLRSDGDLLDKGMAGYRQVLDSRSGNRIWDIEAYMRASANLFAYLQCAGSPRAEAVGAYNWLQENRGRLVTAGSKGDNPNQPEPTAWIPSSPKPGTAQVKPLVMQNLQFEIATPKVDLPPQEKVDWESKYEQLRQENALLQRQYRQLKAAYQGAEEKLKALSQADPRPAGPDTLEEELMELAGRSMRKGQLEASRDLARAVLQLDPRSAPANRLMANIYLNAFRRSNSKEPEARALLWLVSDYMDRAYRLDPDLKSRTGERLQRILSMVPTEEEKAAMGWRDGATLRLNYEPFEWINETVRIR